MPRVWGIVGAAMLQTAPFPGLSFFLSFFLLTGKNRNLLLLLGNSSAATEPDRSTTWKRVA
jgi:hypothetical protein